MVGVVSASTRPGRLSHHVALHLVAKLKARKIESELIDLMTGNPPNYQQSVTQDGTPASLTDLGSQVDRSKGLIWVSPEYNGSYTGALKNLIDMCPKSYFNDKAIGISSVSSGGIGGMRGALKMQHLALATFAIPSPAMLLVGQVQTKFDKEGTLLDEDYSDKVASFLDSYLWLYHKLI